MRTTEVRIETDVSLAGTLTLPESGDPSELVVCVHGTGPMDRDQNMPGQRLDILNTIAEHLAWAGVASYRYDKRGCGSSTGEYYSAGHEDLLNDLLAVIDHFAGDLFKSHGAKGQFAAVVWRKRLGKVFVEPGVQGLGERLPLEAFYFGGKGTLMLGHVFHQPSGAVVLLLIEPFFQAGGHVVMELGGPLQQILESLGLHSRLLSVFPTCDRTHTCKFSLQAQPEPCSVASTRRLPAPSRCSPR